MISRVAQRRAKMKRGELFSCFEKIQMDAFPSYIIEPSCRALFFLNANA